jgi:predicted metallopeptidase
MPDSNSQISANVSTQSIEAGFTNAGPDVYDLLNKVVTSFERFRFIRPSHILIVFKKKGKASWLANIRKLPECLKPFLPGKHVLLTISMIEWDLMTESKKIAVIFHELLHLSYHEGKYRMIKHDIQDFRELVSKLGIDYENSDILLKEIKADSNDNAPKELE